jgi:hypothetical protein
MTTYVPGGRARSLLLALGLAALVGCGSASAASAAGEVGWTIGAVSEPSAVSAGDTSVCETQLNGYHGVTCDRDQLLVTNDGEAEASAGVVTLVDRLPAGITTTSTPESGEGPEGARWECTEGAGTTVVTCTFAEPVPRGGYAPPLDILVSSPTSGMSGTLHNEITVSGGGALEPIVTTQDTPISSLEPPFAITQFSLEAHSSGSGPATGAGVHPWEVTTQFGIPSVFAPVSTQVSDQFQPVQNVKSVSVELPPGLIGDPQATVRCTQIALRNAECPPASRVGAFTILAGALAEFQYSGKGGFGPFHCCSAIYNMVPEGKYPAEFAFTFASQAVFMYANIANGPGGRDGVRITVAGIPDSLETTYAAITFYGAPGLVNGSESDAAFLTNPANCSAGPLSSQIELAAWEDPTSPVRRSATAYPRVTGCEQLAFHPSLGMAPSSAGAEGTSQADSPSAYTADLNLPQTTKFSELATPELEDATVTLPAGVSLSPSAAQGLTGCRPEGPEGINIGSDHFGAGGQDLGDPEATELGAGHAGGNGSPYDDGFYHTAPGHCPAASTLGTVDISTPLLPTRCGSEGQPVCEPGESPAPLQGHIYLKQPECGGAGQKACSEASATNGELYGLYLEAEGSGVIIKLAGTVSADPQTGQLTASFKENPQLPLEELQLHFHGGPRAPIANPQSCGSFATTSTLTSWAGQEVSGAAEPFSITGCAATVPFSPSFAAGTTVPAAGAFSPFTLSFSRRDGEQDLSGLSVTLAPGLLAKIAGVPLCGEPQAEAGSCGPESQIGTASVLAGAGEDPLYVPGGRVYLTGGYKEAPFGLSIVVPAVAGPFNLGNVVVRAKIEINPHTSQVTVVSDPLPQIKDGVPFRLRTVNVEVNRPGFTFNPTSCAAQQITATITATQGASAGVASPFAVTGCAGLPFKPGFAVSTAGKASKANGASLDVSVTSGAGQANIAKVKVQLPKQLPSRLTTLQKACLANVFEANPAACPKESDVGTATALTPVLASPLSGPAYLVSHGGAAFPDLEIVLQGEGVTLILDGKTDIKHGITTSSFESIPDAPVSSFKLDLPTGKYSILGTDLPISANYDLCRQSLVMPTILTGQNGAAVTQNTKISITGCPTILTRAQKLAKALSVCRKKAKRGRAACETKARRRYGPIKKKKK